MDNAEKIKITKELEDKLHEAGIYPETLYFCSYPASCDQLKYMKINHKAYPLCRNCNLKCSYRKVLKI